MMPIPSHRAVYGSRELAFAIALAEAFQANGLTITAGGTPATSQYPSLGKRYSVEDMALPQAVAEALAQNPINFGGRYSGNEAAIANAIADTLMLNGILISSNPAPTPAPH